LQVSKFRCAERIEGSTIHKMSKLNGANNFITKYFQKWADERPRQYVSIWVTSWAAAAWSWGGIMWGWNIWVDTIYEVYYGDAPKTMGRGQVIYAMSMMGVVGGFGLTYLSLGGFTRPGLEINLCCFGKTKRFLLAYYWIALFLCPLGLCVMGIAVMDKHIGLLYVGCILFGLGIVFFQPFSRVVPTLSYTNVGLRGLGSGIVSGIPGIWAAAFSFWGPALTDAWSVQGCMFFAAIASFVLGLYPIPFGMVSVADHTDKYPNEAPKTVKEGASPEPVEAPPAPPVKLTAVQLAKTVQCTMLNVSFFFALIPAFGIKYLIAPMLSSVFDAPTGTQNFASFLFLMFYSNGRFWPGFFDRYINPIWTYRILLVVVAIVYPVLSTMAQNYDHHGAQTGFIVSQC
jgi:hypothetical protein